MEKECARFVRYCSSEIICITETVWLGNRCSSVGYLLSMHTLVFIEGPYIVMCFYIFEYKQVILAVTLTSWASDKKAHGFPSMKQMLSRF